MNRASSKSILPTRTPGTFEMNTALEWYRKWAVHTQATPSERWGYLTALFMEGLIADDIYRQEVKKAKEEKKGDG